MIADVILVVTSMVALIVTFCSIGRIMQDQAALANTLTSIAGQLTNAATELSARITALETRDNGTIPAVDAAVTALQGAAQAITTLATTPASPAP
jgi:hypothetical protein